MTTNETEKLTLEGTFRLQFFRLSSRMTKASHLITKTQMKPTLNMQMPAWDLTEDTDMLVVTNEEAPVQNIFLFPSMLLHNTRRERTQNCKLTGSLDMSSFLYSGTLATVALKEAKLS